jgi:hypothetical protein
VRTRSLQLKPSFNKSGQNSFPAPEKAFHAAKAAGEQQVCVMTTITSGSLAAPAAHRDGQSGLLAEVRGFWRQFFARAFDPYRPELHYMRGPGPACRAKQMAISPQVQTMLAEIRAAKALKSR